MPYRYTKASWKKRLAVTTVVLAVLAGGGAMIMNSLSSTTGPASLSATGSVTDGDINAVVLLDGWSWASVRNASPVWYGQNTGSSEKAPLETSPITASQVTWLAKNAPTALAAVAGRMLTAASDIVCSTSGCTTSGESIPLSWFSNLGLVPGYGSMYAGWGITAAIYVANVPIGQSEVALTLSAKDWTPSSISLSSGRGPKGTPYTRVASDGWGRNLYLFSAGLGQFFTPDLAWSSATPSTWESPSVTSSTPQLAVVLKVTTPLFDKGLAEPSEAAAGLNASELLAIRSIPKRTIGHRWSRTTLTFPEVT